MMRPLLNAWHELAASWRKNPATWVLVILLGAAIYSCDSNLGRLSDVCGLAREAIEITTPQPTNPDAALKQVEFPWNPRIYGARALALAAT